MGTPDGQREETLAPGTILGRYEIGRLLGRGGMGAVYEATHRDLKKSVAVKVLSATLATDEAKQRFLREGEAASRIQHPNVVDVTDVGVEGEVSYLVMEFLEGEDLSSRLAREGQLAVRDVADLLLPVCAGLAVAHDEGVVHRDLKPENIFLVRTRGSGVEPKVLDFGVSKLTGRNAMAMTGTAAIFGTPYYMSPEQVRGARQTDQRSDVYALGVVLYECLTGRRPFEADNIYTMLHAIGSGEYPPPRSLRPDLPAALEAVIVRTMRLDPAERFPTVRHLAAALLPFASDKSRMVWTETFSGNTVAPPTPGGAPGPKVSSVSGTRILPPTKATTLGSFTGQHLMVTESPVRSRRGIMTGGVALVGVLGIVGFVALRPKPRVAEPPAPPAIAAAPAVEVRPEIYRVEVDADPPTATFELDGAPAGTRALRHVFSRDGRAHRLVARAPGYRDAVVIFTDSPPDAHLSLDRLAPEAEAASLRKRSAPRSAEPPQTHAHHPRRSSTSPEPATPAVPAARSGAPVVD
jgi:serine/threonine protein kinase